MEMVKNTFSIIIPHYNVPDKLNRLISSIPRRMDLEIIVVDDCSNKNLDKLEFVKSQYPFVKFLSTEIRGGGGKARNIGLKNAIGSYVLFADADDFFLPSIEEILNEHLDSDIDLIVFNAISLNDLDYSIAHRTNHLNKYISLNKSNPQKAELSLRYLFGEPWCKIIKRDVIVSNDILFQECKVHNDTQFSYLIGLYAKTFKICDKVGYVVTDRIGSVSKNNSWERTELTTTVFAKKNMVLKNNNVNVFDAQLYGPFVKCIKRGNIKELLRLKKIIEKYGYSLMDIFTGIIIKTIHNSYK